jgi:hypothetical protein
MVFSNGCSLSQQQHQILLAGQLVTSVRGVCGGLLAFKPVNLCHILHYGSHWLVLGHLPPNLNWVKQDGCLGCEKVDECAAFDPD